MSDNGTKFKNKVLEVTCRQYGIKQTFTTAYYPASNGLVERTNRKILEILRYAVDTTQEAWQDCLSQVAASINGPVNGSTGKTPHYIIFGCDKRLSYDLLAQRPVPVYSVDDYAKKQLNVFTSIHTSVRDKLQASCAEMTHRQHQRAHGIAVDIGDSVMKNSPERQSKTAPKFSGPYLVLEKVQGNKFKLLDP